MTTITIGSLEGGGGVELGQMVAQRLGYDYVDRLILSDVARQAGTTIGALHEREQRSGRSMRERFGRLLRNILEQPTWQGSDMGEYYGPGMLPFLTEEYEELPQPPTGGDHLPEDQRYIEAISTVMNNLAASGDVVIVGRGGSYLLRENHHTLRIGVVARLEDRISRIMERNQIGHDEAQKLISGRDSARAYYFKRLLDVSNSMASELYHLTLNSSDVSFEYASATVADAVQALEERRFRT